MAARYGACESLVFTWRCRAREGVLAAPEPPVFVPVRALDAPGAVAPPRTGPRPAPAPARTDAGPIEIEWGDGHRVRVGSDVNPGALRRVLAALRG